MKNNASLIFSLFLVVGDFLALLAAFSVAYIMRVKFDPRPLLEQIPAATYIEAFLFVLPLWILVHAAIGLYSQSVYENRVSEFGRLMMGSFVGILVVIGYDFVAKQDIFPARLVPVYGLVLGFGFLLLFRSFARVVRSLLFRLNIGISNVLIIGNTAASEEMVEAVRNTRRTGLRILGVVGKKVGGFPYYPSFGEAVAELQLPMHSIIQTELYRDQDKNNEIMQYAQRNHVSYRFVPGNTDLFVGNIEVELFAGLPVINVHQTALIGWGRVVKRSFDLLVSGLLIILLSPILLFIAFLEKLFHPRDPVFFRQTRLTRYNQEFKVFKFRSMPSKYGKGSPEDDFIMMGRRDLAEQFRANKEQIPNDPRITRIGRVLRRTSLDELPQLFNVFKGDISLVGPRALIPQELNTYEKKHAILSIKPGMTGLAQVSGRKDISFEERRQLDVYYVQNWSFWWDIVIMLKTFKAVITSAGAK